MCNYIGTFSNDRGYPPWSVAHHQLGRYLGRAGQIEHPLRQLVKLREPQQADLLSPRGSIALPGSHSPCDFFFRTGVKGGNLPRGSVFNIATISRRLHCLAPDRAT